MAMRTYAYLVVSFLLVQGKCTRQMHKQSGSRLPFALDRLHAHPVVLPGELDMDDLTKALSIITELHAVHASGQLMDED